METAQQRKTQPAEFINIKDNTHSTHYDSINDDDNTSLMTSELQSLSENPICNYYLKGRKNKNWTPSQPTMNDKDVRIKSFTDPFLSSQPSLSFTYDSGYDSASFGLTSDMPSDDESSICPDTGTLNKLRSRQLPRTEYLESSERPLTFAKEYRRRKGKRPSVVSCVFTTSTSSSVSNTTSPVPKSSPRYDRVREMRNRLRSLEGHHSHRKSTTLSKSQTQSTQVDTPIDLKDNIAPSNPIDPPVHRELPIVQHKDRYHVPVSLKQSIMDTIGEIIGINLLLYVLYFIFMLFKDSLSEAMHEDNISLFR